MTTPVTPTYALPYVAEGEPAYLMRARLQALVDRLDGVVLPSTGVAVPGASDLATIGARLGALEADQAAEDALRTSTAVTFSTGFAQFTTAPYGEAVKCWKTAPDRVKVTGLITSVNALGAGGAAGFPMFTLPVGYRPPVQLLRQVWYAPGGTASAAPVPYRCHLATTGVVSVIVHAATPAGSWFQLQDFDFRTVNT